MNIAAPVTYEVGENDWLKSQGMQLRKRMGPWAPRYSAARYYGNNNGTHPPNWDWVQKASDIPAPAPLSELALARPRLHVHDTSPHVGAASSMRKPHATDCLPPSNDVPSPDIVMRSTPQTQACEDPPKKQEITKQDLGGEEKTNATKPKVVRKKTGNNEMPEKNEGNKATQTKGEDKPADGERSQPDACGRAAPP